MLGIIISWSRIYVGVHWPIDILVSIIISFISCILSKKTIMHNKYF